MGDRDHVRYVANNAAWFAAVSPRIPITCALHRVLALGRKVGDEFTAAQWRWPNLPPVRASRD